MPIVTRRFRPLIELRRGELQPLRERGAASAAATRALGLGCTGESELAELSRESRSEGAQRAAEAAARRKRQLTVE